MVVIVVDGGGGGMGMGWWWRWWKCDGRGWGDESFIIKFEIIIYMNLLY